MKRPRFLLSRKSDGLILTGLMFGSPVEVPDAKVELGKPIWINIAYEGDFKGHSSSPDGAVFDDALFSKVVENLRTHPKFKAGPDGIGCQKVVPTDYEHSSEMDPTSGTIPSEGAPSPAWIWDLKTTRENGRLELWALTEITSPKLVQQINEGGYRFTSVAIWGNATDGVTGKKIGPTLTSFAFTNHNFLPDLHPILASAWVSRAESPEEVVIGLRDIFQLSSDATAEQVSAELAEFSDRMLQGTLPEGVKACDIIDRLRSLLGIRLLASNDEVLEAARQMLAGVGYTEGVEHDSTGEPNMPEPIKPNTLATSLASIFKCRDSDESIIKCAQEAGSSTDALKQLQDMFGAKDFQGLLKAAAEQIAMADKVKGLVDALQAANGSMGQMDEAQAEAETDAVVATITTDKTIAARIRPGIFSQRKACLVEQELFGAKVVRVDEAKLKAFRETYPLPPADLALLTKRIFAAPGGQQIALRADENGVLQSGQVAPDNRGAGGDDRRAKVRTLAGRNDTERAMTLLCKERAGFDKLDRLDQVEQAGRWLRGED